MLSLQPNNTQTHPGQAQLKTCPLGVCVGGVEAEPSRYLAHLKGAHSDALEVGGRWVVPLEKHEGAGGGCDCVKCQCMRVYVCACVCVCLCGVSDIRSP